MIAETKSAIKWASKVLVHFLRERPFSTVLFGICTVAVQITTLLSFFLPLKILILAGSDGVPWYFRFFIEPEEKNFWMLILSLAAIGFYLASLAFDRLGRYVSKNASSRILAGANEIAVTTQLREDAKDFYVQFVRIFADSIVFLLGMAIIALIYWPLSIVVMAMVTLEFLIVAALSAGGRYSRPGRLYRWIGENIGEFLNILFAINFLTAFFVLLAYFVLGSGMNILAAILTILILRQGLKGVSSSVTSLRALWLTRPRIDPLIFRSARVEARDRPVGKEFRQVFSRGLRKSQLESVLAGIDVKIEPEGARYKDIAGKNTFLFQLHGYRGREEWHGLQRVFSQDRVNLIQHEEFLFNFIARDDVFAPTVVSRYVESGFHCQILECGSHDARVDFSNHVENMLVELWSLRPPQALINAYQTSHMTLEGRLTEDFLLRMDIAADDSQRERLLKNVLARRDKICRCIGAVPLHIMNPDVNPHHIITDSKGSVSFWNWQRWSIEHIGAFVPGKVDLEMLPRILGKVRDRINDDEYDLNLSHVELVSDAVALEKAIVSDQFSLAFKYVDDILRNPLIQ